MHSLKHYKVLHEKNVILTIETAPTPRIDDASGCGWSSSARPSPG